MSSFLWRLLHFKHLYWSNVRWDFVLLFTGKYPIGRRRRNNATYAANYDLTFKAELAAKKKRIMKELGIKKNIYYLQLLYRIFFYFAVGSQDQIGLKNIPSVATCINFWYNQRIFSWIF